MAVEYVSLQEALPADILVGGCFKLSERQEEVKSQSRKLQRILNKLLAVRLN
jgi:hypothetical protein